MATLYVTEYAELALEKFGQPVAAPKSPSAAEQSVAIGGSSTASSAFGPTTHFIMVHTDSICSLAIGTTPTAVAAAHRMAANETRYYGVKPGDAIAVISNT